MKLNSLILCGVLVVFTIPTLAKNSNTHIKPEYQKWLDEDVRWIITSQEREQFVDQPTDHARDRFIAQFWERRNPSPGSKENAFKREHYRRLAFSNQHFAAALPGWESDRGRTYILYGPPDAITTQSSGAYPGQVWTYRRLNGNSGISFRFVDRCLCGEYRLFPGKARSN